MTTTYYLADERYMTKEEIELARQFDLAKARICYTSCTPIGMKAVLVMEPLEIAIYEDDAKVVADNGMSARTIGEVRQIISDSVFNVSEKDSLRMHRKGIEKVINRLPKSMKDSSGATYSTKHLKDIMDDPDADLRNLFKR